MRIQSTFWPHVPQKAKPSTRATPQPLQVSFFSGIPHFPQKANPGGSRAPQFAQLTASEVSVDPPGACVGPAGICWGVTGGDSVPVDGSAARSFCQAAFRSVV